MFALYCIIFGLVNHLCETFTEIIISDVFIALSYFLVYINRGSQSKRKAGFAIALLIVPCLAAHYGAFWELPDKLILCQRILRGKRIRP